MAPGVLLVVARGAGSRAFPVGYELVNGVRWVRADGRLLHDPYFGGKRITHFGALLRGMPSPRKRIMDEPGPPTVLFTSS